MTLYSTLYLVLEAKGERLEVHVYYRAQPLILDVSEGARVGVASVVEGHVQTTERFHRRIHHAFAVSFLSIAQAGSEV